MLSYDEIIKQVLKDTSNHFKTISNDELSLRDIVFLDEEIDEICNALRELHKSIIDDRYREVLDL